MTQLSDLTGGAVSAIEEALRLPERSNDIMEGDTSHELSGTTSFDAKGYWEDRLSREYSLEGVGRRNLGIHFNAWAYRVRRRVFLRLARALDVDWAHVRALDIGSGTGFYIDCLKELGVRNIVGMDLTDVAVERLAQRYPDCSFFRFDIADRLNELRGTRFDFVSCMDVLFHIVDDDAYGRAFENIYDLMRPGGGCTLC